MKLKTAIPALLAVFALNSCKQPEGVRMPVSRSTTVIDPAARQKKVDGVAVHKERHQPQLPRVSAATAPVVPVVDTLRAPAVADTLTVAPAIDTVRTDTIIAPVIRDSLQIKM